MLEAAEEVDHAGHDHVPTATDHAVAAPSAPRARARTALRAGGVIGSLGLLLGGAVWLSGSSTLSLGVRQDVPEAARPALLLVLEVAAVVGTALWVTANNGREMVRPGIVVVIAGAVTGVGGFLAYNWLGLVAPVMSVLVTDMLAQRWKRTHTGEVQAPLPVDADDHQPAPALHAVPDLDVPTPADPCAAPAHTLVTVAELDDLSRDELRAIAREHDETVRGSAEQLRERLRPVLSNCPHPAHDGPHAPAQDDAEVTA